MPDYDVGMMKRLADVESAATTAQSEVDAAETALADAVDDIETALESKADGTPGVKTYRALLTQTGTNAPVATVLENSLGGTLVWTYSDAGKYVGTLAGAFTANKTTSGAGLVPVLEDNTSLGAKSFAFGRIDDDTVRLTTYSDLSATQANDVLSVPTYIEILVYP